MKKIKGIGLSSGIAIGKAWIWENAFLRSPEYPIEKKEVDKEIERFHNALSCTESELKTLQRSLKTDAGKQYSDIFSYHLSLLNDESLKKRTEAIIENDRINTESALKKVIKQLGMEFEKSQSDFLKDRRRDLLDVIERLIVNLKGAAPGKIKKFKDEIIVARDLSPSQTVSLDRDYIIGFVTKIGSKTSHSAILAKALEIPAVVGGENITTEIKSGDLLIVDANEGMLIVNPTEATVKNYRTQKERRRRTQKKLDALRELPCITDDGHEIHLHANIELPEEIAASKKYGALGIGLYRTEYLFLNRRDLPSEEEQFTAYRKVAESYKKGSVIVRTLDIGGDKFLSALPDAFEKLNPFLGLRGIRFCLERKDIFETQLRAILRAGAYGNLKIMLPMISVIEELLESKKIIEKVKRDLIKDGYEIKKDIETGIMIEIPSAALMADSLSGEADFFSIGSNDLIQYTIAVDRSKEKIAHLYQPCHPSVLKLIKMTVDAAKKNKIWTGLCGEMASIPEIACLLTGLGIEELSMAPYEIPAVKEKIRRSSYQELKNLAEEVLSFDNSKKIHGHITRKLQ